MKKIDMIKKLEQIEQSQGRLSKWRKGVYAIAIDRLDEMDDNTKITWHTLLNGALWDDKEANFDNIISACNTYAWGGCGLVYDVDIADLLATKSEAYYSNGNLKGRPNKSEQWLDLYARAIFQAFRLIIRQFKDEIIEE